MRRLIAGCELRFRTACLALFLSSAVSGCFAATDYTVTLADPQKHLLEIQIVLPEGPPVRELQLPVWNALYQIRDFSQYVNWIHAKDKAGNPVAVHEINKSLWQVSGAENGATVNYQIFTDSFGPFGAQFNSQHAFLNLAQILMYPVDARNSPLRVRFSHLPADWRIATPLQGAGDTFAAETYDRAVDSPVEIGRFQEAGFDEAGGHYRIIVDAEPEAYDMAKIISMLRKLVISATTWMDERPFESYTFFYHFPKGPGGGGMEHAYSTAIALNAEIVSRFPDQLTSVTAHELFHLWNVKRIRPQTLEPVDYTKENYTRALWFSEGCTSTAADFIQLRGGLLDERRFEQELAAAITELQGRPAHLTQSAEESSLDAWLEGDPYYRTAERSISYYNKGELLGIMLDLAVRDASQGRVSLRELFQWMNQNYAKRGRFFDDSAGVEEAADAITHSDMGWFFRKYVSGTEEIPWDDFFHSVGLRLISEKSARADAGFVASRDFDGPMVVESVTSGSDAEAAGLLPGETILEINGSVAGEDSTEAIAKLRPGDNVTVKIRAHRGGERELKWKTGSLENITYELRDVENISAQQRARREAWLKGEAQMTK